MRVRGVMGLAACLLGMGLPPAARAAGPETAAPVGLGVRPSLLAAPPGPSSDVPAGPKAATPAAAPANVSLGALPADPLEDDRQILTLQGENDAASTLKGTSDQYYTSGLRLGWVSNTHQVPDFLSRMGRAIYGDAGVQRISLDLSQAIYTPRDTQSRAALPFDHPYAGYLAVNGSLITDTEDRRTVLGLSLGLVGPEAGGATVQNGFHDLIGDPENKGWKYQLRDEPTIQLLSEGTWRLPIAQFAGFETDALPTIQLGVGNVRDYVLSGARFRIGQGLTSDFGPARMQPGGMNGTDAYKPTRDFAWYFFAGADGQLVAHDIFLDGNTWRGEGPHVSKKWYLGEMDAGLGVIWEGVRLTYTQTWQTEQFHGQKGGLFNFGSLAASVRF